MMAAVRSWQVAVLSILTVGVVAVGGALGYRTLHPDQRTYPGSVRDNFRVSCAEAGGSDDVCNCALRALEDEYTLEEFTRLDRIARDGDPNVAAEIQAPVAKRCATAPSLALATTTTTARPITTTTGRPPVPGSLDVRIPYPAGGPWTTTKAGACPYELIDLGKVFERGTKPTVEVPSQIQAFRFSSSCPFEPGTGD